MSELKQCDRCHKLGLNAKNEDVTHDWLLLKTWQPGCKVGYSVVGKENWAKGDLCGVALVFCFDFSGVQSSL